MVLALARTYKQDHIQEKYLSFVLTHAQQVMRTEGFLQLDVALLMKVLEADEARIEEIDLFMALVKWHQHWSREVGMPGEKECIDQLGGRASPSCGTSPKADKFRQEESQVVGPEEMQRLFATIRYGQMTGPQLVTEVKPFVGTIVPRDLYVRALEQVVAPGQTTVSDDDDGKQSMRRHPPLGCIHTSDPQLLTVNSTAVEKVGSSGWNCTAVIDPSTCRTCFRVEHLSDLQNGIGVAIFDPERNALRSGSSAFPNPNHWGTDCLAGIYGTGCFFGIVTEHTLTWQVGLTVEITMRTERNSTLHVSFAAEGIEGRRQVAEGCLSVPQGVKLAVALYSPEDRVTVEPRW